MRSFSVFLLAVLALNIWATWRVSRSTLASHRRLLLTIGTWLIPLIGAGIAISQTSEPAPPPMPEALPDAGPAAPEVLQLQGLPDFPLGEHLFNGQGFPIL